MKVNQVMAAAGPVDAVTGQALAFRSLFRSWGWEGRDFAVRKEGSVPRRAVAPVRELWDEPGDVAVLHYSGYAHQLDRVLALDYPTLLISHNITPARYFWREVPAEAVSCTIARIQLAELAAVLPAAAGVSEFNAAELRAAGASNAEVIPVLFDRARLGEPGPAPDGPPTILFVGRLAPHKRQDRVIRAFAMYRRHRAPDARLVLVGNPVTPPYGMTLRTLADELAPGAVTIESGLSPEALWDRYRSAHAFLCLSEHEGFCVPLLEAFHFGVPVIARPAGGIAEVAGDAALLTEDDDVAVIAELLHLAVSDAELRAELRARGQRRLEEFAYERTAERLRAAVSRLAA